MGPGPALTTLNPVALTRERILETALGILRSYGLADLSMRRLAQELDVAPGALYYHVHNKQELLNLLAARLLQDPPRPPAAADLGPAALGQEILAQAEHLRQALMEFPDAADVVSLALALHPESIESLSLLQELVGRLMEQGPDQHSSQPGAGSGGERSAAGLGAQSVVHLVLGFVRAAQDRARAQGVPVDHQGTALACRHGVGLLLAGLAAGLPVSAVPDGAAD